MVAMHSFTSQNFVQILMEARNKLTLGWCQGAWARDINGFSVHSDSGSACQWCIAGSIDSCGGTDAWRVASRVWLELYGFGLAKINDEYCGCPEDAISYIDNAISMIEAGRLDILKICNTLNP